MTPDDREKVSTIRMVTGIQLRLSEHETILHTQVSELCIMVSVRTHLIKELVRETRTLKQGWKLVELTRPDVTSRWHLHINDPVWDESFIPVYHDKFGTTLTPAEEAAKREWELDCYRPGTGRSPRDNADRRLQGYDYTSPQFYTTQSDKK